MELLYVMGAVFGLGLGWFAHEQFLRWRAERKPLRAHAKLSPIDTEHHYYANGHSENEAARLFDKVAQQLHDEHK